MTSRNESTGFWYIDDSTKDLFIVINTCIIFQIINCFGILGNIVNVVVLWKQRFKETMNISLLGLTISDLGCLITLQWMNLCFNPLFGELSLPFRPLEVQYVTAGWPHACFARITALITAFITLERCLCIALPLKVKMIMTPSRTVFIIVVIFLAMLISTAPITAVNLWQWKFDPALNRSVMGIVRADNWLVVERVTFALNNVYGYIAFVAVTILTIVLVRKLTEKTKWRQESAGAATSDSTASKRDLKVIKMVVTMSIFFIVCFFPTTAVFLGTMSSEHFGIDGKYSNTFHVLCQFAFGLETINSSVNIFIYLKMSSKYRETFMDLFFCVVGDKIKKNRYHGNQVTQNESINACGEICKVEVSLHR